MAIFCMKSECHTRNLIYWERFHEPITFAIFRSCPQINYVRGMVRDDLLHRRIIEYVVKPRTCTPPVERATETAYILSVCSTILMTPFRGDHNVTCHVAAGSDVAPILFGEVKDCLVRFCPSHRQQPLLGAPLSNNTHDHHPQSTIDPNTKLHTSHTRKVESLIQLRLVLCTSSYAYRYRTS